MTQMIIRDLDEDVVARLKARAERLGVSLEELAREALVELSRQEKNAAKRRAEAIRQLDAIRASSRRPAPGEPDSTQIIREFRDRDYRFE